MNKEDALQVIALFLSLSLMSCGGGSSNSAVSTNATNPTETSVDSPSDQLPVEPAATPASPPFSGTIFVDADIVTPDDPSSFVSITATGKGERIMFDRRPADWVTLTPYLFNAQYDDGLSIELQVNPEFSESEAVEQAEIYARYFGQLPTLLRRDVDTSWIHKGINPYGGGNRNLLIHTGQSEEYLRDGILEETLIHEASHTSLDSYYAAADEWLLAQQSDPTFISIYAMDNPDREDIAESFLLYVALRYRRDRISNELAATIEASMPGRIQFFDTIVQDMYPLE